MPTYTATCPWCGQTRPFNRKPPNGGVIGCGVGPCVDAHNAAVAEADRVAREQAAARRAERKANPPQRVVAGEWGMAVLIGQAAAKRGRRG